MAIANTAGGIQVTKAGTAVVSAVELQRALVEHRRG
jgi:bifunctional ADP-heptose synthase (sugar kinase/adenylyltransferase)